MSRRPGSRERLQKIRRRGFVLPSVLSADFAALGKSMAPLEESGVEVFHLDVMDGHFVPNITFGPPLVRSIRAHTDAFLDTHLMITDPMRFLEPFAKAGSDLCTVHAELDLDPALVAAEAGRLDIGLGVSLRPSTPLRPLLPQWAPHVDLILIMSVEPGFGGQSFMPEALDRLRETVSMCGDLGVSPVLEVDGGIDDQTAPLVVEAGARWLVAGSAVFRREDPVAAWRGLSMHLPQG
jgi:ribulose-phosphate 3-epimerase